jgi:hypothetical protein
MSNQSIPQNYANDLMFDLQKAFWDERGLGARFRTVSVGREHFKSQVLPQLATNEIGDFIRAIEKALKDEGIVAKISFTEDGRLLRVKVEGCIHRAVEERLAQFDIPPFTCVPANLIAFAIEEKLDRPVELAEIKVEADGCNLLLVTFEQRPVLR